MALTLTEKIIMNHLVDGTGTIPTRGSDIAIRIDQTLTQDATGTMAYLQFETIGIDRVKTELSVSYIDHNTLQEDYKNMDDLFLASDIFILPTYNKSFSSNIVKAMFCRCAVFLSIENDAKEIVDVFASMDSPTDPSMMFKVDAILKGRDDLKLIKNENRKLASEFSLANNLVKINTIIGNI